MRQAAQVALGLDFGTESVRAILVSLTGQELSTAVCRYRHGQITTHLPGSKRPLPADFALQQPADWMASASRAVRQVKQAAGIDAQQVVGIGVDFTSCTMLPTKLDGTPLCHIESLMDDPFAWPKLWKHHGAKKQTDRINAVARQREEPFLKRYGGTIGLEWFFPKMLETIESAPKIQQQADVWIEAGDWFVWQLVGGPASDIPRSTCQAGYKAMWSRADGYPTHSFFHAIDPRLASAVRDKLPGRMVAPGTCAGLLGPAIAKKLGLRAGTPVSAAIIDAHAGVPGAGAAEPGTLVMVIGTSSCHMLNATDDRFVPGVAGVVEDGILPGLYGYETGQAAVGDAFDWLRRTFGEPNFDTLTRQARELPAGADGVICLDWMNGCRTPLMDGNVTGAFTGLTLRHQPAHWYRALLEGSAFGVRWIVELLETHGVPVKKVIATGGLPHHNPLLVEIYANVLGRPIHVHPSTQGPALGAAILGALAAGASVTKFRSTRAAVTAMAGGGTLRTVRPDRTTAKAYEPVYDRYRQLADSLR